MTKHFTRQTRTFCLYIGILLPSFALASQFAHSEEAAIASAHICSGCASCDRIAASVPLAIESGCVDQLRRTGHPETQSEFAKPSLSKHYSFGYVGGGASFGGEPRFVDEGTWGVDYSGILWSKRIWLRWMHGQDERRGEGSYQTDGPHLLRH